MALAVLYISGGTLFRLAEREAELNQYKENRELFDSMKELWSWERCREDYFRTMEFCANQEYSQHSKKFEQTFFVLIYIFIPEISIIIFLVFKFV